MTNPTTNTIKRIHEWKEKNRLTDQDFENAGFNEIIQIVKDQENDIELERLEIMQEYNLEHAFNDEKINQRIRELRNQKP
ncbi:hypothetical protein [Flavobacterium sp. 102]|uniref:hypothetical protein n=1 Tax=Flavobacterium sp. 102 TaxID=2135623 RepID=UPI000EB164CB|nr:hypothetical protein [Flavobacterium sp. 102]RKS00441.1 hypothetical protein C8C84_0051 [Flavobacterium sp. 102]